MAWGVAWFERLCQLQGLSIANSVCNGDQETKACKDFAVQVEL